MKRRNALLLVLLVGCSAGSVADPVGPLACDDPSVDPWVHEFRDRVVKHGEFALYASGRYGAVVSCHGAVTDEFDGLKFGMLKLGYSEGVELHVETMPLETSVVTFRVPTGFDDAAALELLRRYVDRVGVEVDWSDPRSTTADERTTIAYLGTEPGTNASARTIRVNGKIRELQFSMAL